MGRRTPSCTSHMDVHTSSRNQRSCVTTSRPPLPACQRGLEVVGEPVDGAHVQMVGGLVEHEHVVIADEQAREVHAAALTARESSPARPSHGTLGNQARPGSGARAGSRAHSCSGMSPTTARCTVLAAVERESRWPNTPRPRRGGASRGPRRARGRAGEHGQQARLAVAVLAHDADAVALVDAQGDVPSRSAWWEIAVPAARNPSKMAISTCSSHSYSQPFILAGSGALTAGVEGAKVRCSDSPIRTKGPLGPSAHAELASDLAPSAPPEHVVASERPSVLQRTRHALAASTEPSVFPALVSARNNQESSRGISSRAQFRTSRRPLECGLRASSGLFEARR